jgi:hypothetical protein
MYAAPLLRINMSGLSAGRLVKSSVAAGLCDASAARVARRVPWRAGMGVNRSVVEAIVPAERILRNSQAGHSYGRKKSLVITLAGC